MKTFLIASLALIPNIAIAHPGHIEAVSGHTHSVAELVAFGLAFAIAAALALHFVRAKLND